MGWTDALKSRPRSRNDTIKELVKRAGGQSSRTISQKSRMLRFSPATLYFLLLEKEWWFCAIFAMTLYGLPVVLISLVSLPLNFHNETEEAELEYNGVDPTQAVLAFRFTASNVIGMGYGSVFPTSNIGYLIATVSQLLGILINGTFVSLARKVSSETTPILTFPNPFYRFQVFVFAVVLAKYQSPSADVVFSKKALIFTRDGVRHLCLRVGNLRCHTLYNPSLRLFVLTNMETEEGETFVSIEELEVGAPGTVSGVYNITHKIDEDSPLYHYEPGHISLQVVFSALDPIYQAEVCAKSSYRPDDFVTGGQRFADMMRVDVDENGKIRGIPTLDFTYFDELVDQEQRWPEGELPMENSERPPKVSDTIILCMGMGRASYGDPRLDKSPRTGLEPECSFSCSVAMVLAEAGVPYTIARVDLGGKPKWLKDVNEKEECPNLLLANTEEWLVGTDHIIKTLATSHPVVREFGKSTPPDHINGTSADFQPHLAAFALLMVHANPETAPPARSFLLKKFECKPNWDKHRCEVQIQKKAREILERWEVALAAQGDYLCGDEPGILDCSLIFLLYLAFQLFESGLANLGASFKDVAPRAYQYMVRFSERQSWSLVFGAGRGVGANGRIDLVTVRTISNKWALIAPEMTESIILPALEKARTRCLEEALPMENSERPPKVSDTIILCMGMGRASYGDPRLDKSPRTGLEPECSFSCSVAMVLAEAGVPYTIARVDLGGKPKWLKDVNEKEECPNLLLANTEEWLVGTDHIIKTLATSHPVVREFGKSTPPDHINGTSADFQPHLAAFALLMVHANPETAPPARSFLLKKFECKPNWDKHRCEVQIQKKAREILERWEVALAAQGDYLCGDEPGILDCSLIFLLYLAFQLFESGLANLGASFKDVAPRAYQYMVRFSERQSWSLVFGAGRGVGANGRIDLVTVRTISNKWALIAPEMTESIILPALEKARGGKRVLARSVSSVSSASSVRSLRLRTQSSKKVQHTLCL